MHRQKPLSWWFVAGSCLLGTALGLLVITGWVTGSTPLCNVAGAPLDPTAAAGLILASVSTWLSCRGGARPGRLARVLAGTVVGLGALPLVRRFAGWGLRRALILPEGVSFPEPHFGEPAFATALILALLGMSLLALDRQWVVSRVGALFGPLSVGFLALTLFRGGADGGAHSIEVPLGAGLVFALLALAIIVSHAEQTGALRGPWPARYALILGLVGTLSARRLAESAMRETARRQFEGDVGFAAQTISRRVERYLGVLHGTGALFASRPELERHEFSAYVRQLDLPANYPGLDSLAFVRVVSSQNLTAEIDTARREGLSEFDVWPKDERELYAPVLLVEPFDAEHRTVLGYDMASEPRRREAMARARESGKPVLSEPLLLENPGSTGFSVFVPVYGHEAPADTDARTPRIAGFVVGTIEARALFADSLTPELTRRISLTIFDREPAPERVLYRDRPASELPEAPSHVAIRDLEVAGTSWKVRFVALPDFDRDAASSSGTYVLLGGLLVSLLAFFALRTQIRAREQAEESVATRDMFISVASHELKTPLTPLRLNAQSIVESALEGKLDRSALLAKARGVERSSKKLDAMIDRLLDVSRISLGQLQLKLEEVDLRELLRTVIADMQAEIAASGSVVELSAPAPVIGRWDRFRLEQVVSNLLRNSLKFGRRRPIRLELERTNDRAVLRVRDQGIGIAKADLERVFLRFERAVSDQHYGGFGLGLWIAHQIVDRHGGSIRLSSAMGKGSTFTITLPLEAPA